LADPLTGTELELVPVPVPFKCWPKPG